MSTELTIVIWLVYLIAAVLFILGMKRLSSAETARSGNLWAAVGMAMPNPMSP